MLAMQRMQSLSAGASLGIAALIAVSSFLVGRQYEGYQTAFQIGEHQIHYVHIDNSIYEGNASQAKASRPIFKVRTHLSAVRPRTQSTGHAARRLACSSSMAATAGTANAFTMRQRRERAGVSLRTYCAAPSLSAGPLPSP